MTQRRDPKPIEKPPKDARLPVSWREMHASSLPYRPRSKPVQEDWGTVARKFGIGVQELIYFNFMTIDPDEVNYYLRTRVGCKQVSPSGNNWMFSNDAAPGIIFIPPPETREFDFKPEEICSWMPNDAKDFLMRLSAVAQTITGEQGKRIRRLVRVILQAGFPAAKELWYYNDMNVREYIDWKVPPSKRREMTKHTGGIFPFDGESGLYRQQGRFEHHRGYWRIHPIRDLFDDFGCVNWDSTALKERLISVDRLIFAGWHEMSLIDFRTQLGGGNAYDDAIENFVNHVINLSKNKTHLYWAVGS
jgi:hypothetical protein